MTHVQAGARRQPFAIGQRKARNNKAPGLVKHEMRWSMPFLPRLLSRSLRGGAEPKWVRFQPDTDMLK
jgi:hypothetical protein